MSLKRTKRRQPPYHRPGANVVAPLRALPHEPRRILVVKLFALGALLNTTPTLRALPARFPHSRKQPVRLTKVVQTIECDRAVQSVVDKPQPPGVGVQTGSAVGNEKTIQPARRGRHAARRCQEFVPYLADK